MTKNKIKISHIHATPEVENSELLHRYQKRFPNAQNDVIQTDSELDALFNQEADAKRHVLITTSKGQNFKPCPGTDRSYICCNYWVLNQSTNCPIDCSYCILQFYLNNPVLTVYSNVEAMKREISQRKNLEPDRFFRVGTGELADSLALDGFSEVAPGLIRYAASERNLLLELKTKSVEIDHLLNLNHLGHTVISWSVNSEIIIEKEEHGAASLDERLAAAVTVQKAGYKLAFHFDPIIYHRGWKEAYTKVIQKMAKSGIRPDNIVWISLGSLRFPPDMKTKILDKFPKSIILSGEMILGKDGKMRYVKAQRLEMYRHIYQLLKEWNEKLFIYFCMEDADIWKQVMNFAPENNEHLDYLFASNLYGQFPGLMEYKPEREKYQQFITPRHRENSGKVLPADSVINND